MQEIERKFLLARPPSWLERRESRQIEQGYLAIAEDAEVRLRRIGGERLLTVKRGAGETREEVEVGLEVEAFERLWELTASRRLLKRRYAVPLEDGHRAEVDVYEGELAGLIVAEVEFGSEAEADGFRPPAWLGAELTGERRYANQELARHGLPDDLRRRGRESRGYALKKGERPSAGMARIARGRAEKAADRLAAAREGRDPTASVHGARKDLKKLRSLLRLLRSQLGEERYRVANAAFREAGRLLSESRDAAVKAKTLEALCEDRGGLPAGAAAEWLEVLREERAQAEAATRGEAAALEEALGLVEAGRDRVESWPLESDGWKLAGPGLERAYRRGRRAMRRVAADPDPAAVHEWRKRVKDIWYQLRILAVATPPGLSDRVEIADRLADVLGDHHDLAVLRDDLLLRELPTVNRPALVAAIVARQEELADRALALGDRLYAEKPKRFTRKMRRGWRKRFGR
ncbi:MAG: CHAD domain-containing protein [Solirubrobacterales bacterium]